MLAESKVVRRKIEKDDYEERKKERKKDNREYF